MLDRRKLLCGLGSAPFATTAAAQSGLPLVGVLSPASPQAAVIKLVNEPFKKAMATLGHVPGRTIDYAERYADGDDSRLPALAAELVALRRAFSSPMATQPPQHLPRPHRPFLW